MTSWPYGTYLRAFSDDSTASFEYVVEPPAGTPTPDPGDQFCVVDVVARGPVPSPTSDRLTEAVQAQAHHLVSAGLIVIRWPWLAGPGQPSDEDATDAWIRRLKGEDGEPAVIGGDTCVAVITHVVGEPTIVRWSGTPPENSDLALVHARSLELNALLGRANAIWAPKTYHYRLPDGQHVGTFVRLADAVQSPRDAFVLASWLTARLANGVSVVADTGGLTPIVIQLEAMLERFGWELGVASTLRAYPAGRSNVRRAVESARNDFGTRLIGLQSVSSSGSLSLTLADEIERAATSWGQEWSLDIFVDRNTTVDHCIHLAPTDEFHEIAWLGLGDGDTIEAAGACRLCRDTNRAQFVAVDPRTYGEMALPRPHLVMPDTTCQWPC